MQYLVYASGKVANLHEEVYAINAKNPEQAQEIAEKRFKKQYNVIGETIYVPQSYSRTKRAIFAIILMLIAIVISFIPFEYERFFLFWQLSSHEISLKPELISIIAGIAFYSAFVVRFKGLYDTSRSLIDIVLSVLSIFLLSSIFKLTLCGEKMYLLPFISVKPIIVYLLVFFAFALSWIRAKSASVICMCIIAILSISNIQKYSEAMGIYGVIYAICSFLGILFHLSIEPKILMAMPHIYKKFKDSSNSIKNDFSDASEEIKSIKKNNIKKKALNKN